jgi:hypothetical protein
MSTGEKARTALAVVNLEEAASAASYNALLTANPTLAARSWDALVEAQRRAGVEVAGRPLCTVLRPRFITASRAVELERAGTTFARLMERAGDIVLGSERLLDAIGASEQEREIWSVDPGYPGFTVTSRLDSFMVGTTPRFIEYNAESPAGIAFSDVLASIFKDLPAIQTWEPFSSMYSYEARRSLLDALLWAYHERGGRGVPRIAIIDWEHVITRRDFELCADYFRSHGVQVQITDPRRLEYRHGKLWLGGEPISLVYRRVLLHELLEKADEAADLLRAYRDGAVCVVNSPRSKLLHKKAIFALLAEGVLGLELSDDEHDLLERSLPWTRLVEDGRTTYENDDVDLVPFILERRESLALKPVDDYGGKGVVLGWESTPDGWEQAIERALQLEYVVQERVPMPQGEFPLWSDGGVAIEPLLIDTDPLLFRCEMGGILTRVSSNTLLNVSAGTGSAAATFVVREEGG